MKKAFEIWIDDDAEIESFCGTIVSNSDEMRGVTSVCLAKKDIEGKVGYYFPIKGNGAYVVAVENRDKCKNCANLTDVDEKILSDGSTRGKGRCKKLDISRRYSDKSCTYFKDVLSD